MDLLNLLVGMIFLAFGRKVFWLFVGCVGFVAGFTAAHQIWGVESELIVLAIAVASGCIGAVLAVFFQGLTIGLAGFVAGGYISMILSAVFGFETGSELRPVYLIGGILGAVILFMAFDWALILLSSLSGAAIVVQTVQVSALGESLIYALLVVFGIGFQTFVFKRERTRASHGKRKLKM